jgi:glycosyltransferase involved in cell wall biosynthesis
MVESSPWSQLRAFVFDGAVGDRYAAGRTLRAIGRCGMAINDVCGASPERLADVLSAAPGSILLVRAGAWLVDADRLSIPPPSATGLPLCALGAVRAETAGNVAPHEHAAHWSAFHAITGGDFASNTESVSQLPPVAIAYLEAPVVESLVRRLVAGEGLETALCAELSSPQRRVVRYAPLDVHFDPSLRIVQLVTSLQQGGAERIALDLHRTLGGYGVHSLLVALGSPTRAAFPAPPGTVDLSRVGPGRPDRIAAAADVALSFAADLVHGHLLHAADVAQLSTFGLPVVLTVHNMPPGWPKDFPAIQPRDAALLVACSQAVEAELRKAKIPIPIRTVWNGIGFDVFERRRGEGDSPVFRGGSNDFAKQSNARREKCDSPRGRLGIADGDFVLLALANPRPQKRLERLPPILAATRSELAARGCARELRLIIAGEPSRIDPAAAECETAVDKAIADCGVSDWVHRLRSVEDVPSLLRAGNALISTSAYEGLSLAHLEALAAGLPVVTTDVGGAAEVAHGNPAVFLLPADAGPAEFARVIADLVGSAPRDGRAAAELHFTRYRMAEGYRRLYPRAIARSPVAPRKNAVENGETEPTTSHAAFAERKPTMAQTPTFRRRSGLWLVTNNFSMGGAQSSARRLLLGMADRGIRVRAAVLEEQPEYPTPGRQALVAAGVAVLALRPAGTIDPTEAVALLLEKIDADPPDAVMFWNAIAQHKILLADSLLDIPVFDVSPGEMYFSSLAKYFEHPRPGLPYRTTREYGARLSGMIVKFAAEAAKAADWLGAPVHVVPNGVPLDELTNGRPHRDRLVIGTAARISPQKKLEELFAALRRAGGRMPQYELQIAGGVERGADDYARRLREEAAGLPVRFVGERQDPREFYRGLDLFVMISEPAGCPNASLEAMAAGLPVVATDVGGASEQVVDGVNGRLAPRGDCQALADVIVAVAANEELRRRYGSASRERIATRFAVHRMVDDYCRILFPND